jgi:hypothetical protein
MGLPYENSTTGSAALTEIQKILRRFGCSSFGVMEEWDAGAIKLQFIWSNRPITMTVSSMGYAAAWLKEHPYSHRMRRTKQEHNALALEKGQVAVYSILRDWIKGQVTAVETGIMSFEQVFLPHMMLPSGDTVHEMIVRDHLPQLELNQEPQQ